MPHEIVFRERYGVLGQEVLYVKPPEQNTIIRLGSSLRHQTFFQSIKSIFQQVFLPQGYPESVSDDYYSYQIWDTCQAFCSTITGTLTTQAVLMGFGVGDTTATPLAATITWILKDGTGMIGRILFAWWKGAYLDADCKKWRLSADLINDVAMCLELIVPDLMGYKVVLLCTSTAMKSVVGVAGGATRAAITQHQATRGNTGDVSAKDGSQETFVNLCASLAGILILSVIDGRQHVWHLFLLFTALHLFANYKAVKALKMNTFNVQRLNLVLQTYLTTKIVPSPEIVNSQESVILGQGLAVKDLCGHSVRLGMSLKNIIQPDQITAEDLKLLANLYRGRQYLLVPDLESKTIYITFHHNETTTDVLQSYFHAVLLGIATNPHPLITKSHKPSTAPIHCTSSRIKFSSKKPSKRLQMPLEAMISTNDTIMEKFEKLIEEMSIQGWNVNHHYLPLDEWRGDWLSTHLCDALENEEHHK